MLTHIGKSDIIKTQGTNNVFAYQKEGEVSMRHFTKTTLYLETREFKKAIDFAEQHDDINGVFEVLNQIQSNFQEYCQLETPNINIANYHLETKYRHWEIVHKLKKANLFAFIGLISFLIIGRMIHLFDLLLVFALFLFIIVIVMVLLFPVIEFVFYHIYRNFLNKIKSKHYSTLQSYLKVNDNLYRKVDNLYLSSLEPHHRELILMRRQQDKQHTELLEQQSKFFGQILEAQKEISEENRLSRELTEKILEIEKEREREKELRRGGY